MANFGVIFNSGRFSLVANQKILYISSLVFEISSVFKFKNKHSWQKGPKPPYFMKTHLPPPFLQILSNPPFLPCHLQAHPHCFFFGFAGNRATFDVLAYFYLIILWIYTSRA